MKFARNIRDLLVWVMLGLAIVLFAAAFAVSRAPGDTSGAARRLSRTIERRMGILEQNMDKALNQSPYEWMELDGLPSDMVVYRYCKDTLQSWTNQFSIRNDGLTSGVMFQVLTNPRIQMESPLSQARDTVSFVNIGPRWYLLKSVSVDDCKVIGGLEIMSTQSFGPFNGVNRHLKLNDKFVINPLSYDEGSVVVVEGAPQFKVFYESLVGRATAEPSLAFIALALIIAGGILFLINKKMKL